MSQPPTVDAAAEQIRRGELTPTELLEQCLAEIHAHEDRLHAWVEIDEPGARRTAEQLQREAYRGPLHGIPLGIKDIIDVEGLPTRAGSPLRPDHPAPGDAPLVAALRWAGAVLLGKTVTVEFACFDPSPTRNPWDPALRHTPGGSSSGSAAAVAAGMCLGAIGTQTGGSLVRPAAYCGVATCKPTFGRISTQGIVPVSHHLDHPGPTARRVTDLAILLGCLLGDGEWNLREPSGPPRLGLLEGFFMEGADRTIRRATRAAVDCLDRCGARVESLEFPHDLARVKSMHRTIMAVEAAAYHREQFAANRGSYGPLLTELLDEGLRISGVDYAAALDWQRQFRRHVHSFLEGLPDVEALIMPSTDTTAPPTLETTGTPKFQAPWSCAGVPAVSIPCGLGPDRMPAGLQLVGRAGRDTDLLRTARWCEQALGFAELPPLLRSDG